MTRTLKLLACCLQLDLWLALPLVIACSGSSQRQATTITDEAANSEPSHVALPACTSTCEPREVAPGDNVFRLVVDEENLYWVDERDLVGMPRGGGQTRVLLREVSLNGIVQDTSALYACTHSTGSSPRSIYRIPKDGTAPQQLAEVIGPRCNMVSDGEFLYFGSYDARGSTRGLFRVFVDGGDVEDIARGAPSVGRLAIDDDSVYWTTQDGRQVIQWSKSTNSWAVLADDQVVADAIAADDEGYVYWTTLSRIMRRKRGEEGEIELLASHIHVDDITTSQEHLYFSSNRDRRVGRLSQAGGSLELIELTSRGPTAHAVVGDSLYWVERTEEGGRIMTVDTCSCGPPLLTTTPSLPPTTGPDSEPPCRYATFDPSRQVYTMVVRDLSATEEDDLDELSTLFAGDVPSTDPRIPSRFSLGDRWDLATASGTTSLPVKGFAAYLGASETYLEVHLEAPPGATDNPGIVLPRGVEHSDVRLVPAKATPPRGQMGRRLMAALRTQLDESGRSAVELTPRQVTVVQARLPQPHAYIVSVEIDRPRTQMSDFTANLTALFLVDSLGNITETIEALDERLDTFTIRNIIDIDDDAIDEIHIGSQYYEGGYEHLLQWEGETPVLFTMAGDGA